MVLKNNIRAVSLTGGINCRRHVTRQPDLYSQVKSQIYALFALARITQKNSINTAEYYSH